METTIKKFVCTNKVQESETTYKFKAVLKSSHDTPYQIKVYSHIYKHGKKTAQTYTTLYFEKKEDMINEFKYYYALNKNNLFTDSIKIIK